jgi:hypothetical protein
MNVRLACAAAFLIGTSLLLLASIRSTQAAVIKVVSPGAYEDIEGEGSASGCCSPDRFQQVFPAADFAALGNQPHWIVGFSWRPDQSVSSPRTVRYPDNEVRLSTTQSGPDDLSRVFNDNFGSDVTQFYRGLVIAVADFDEPYNPGPGPREFYHTNFPAGVAPFLYDPSQGNLLFDLIAWQGNSPASTPDQIPGLRTALHSENPLGTQGGLVSAVIFQFTFVPVTPGDYNQDGTVDTADYVVWRNGLGTTYTQADHDVWRANFGQTIGSGGALPSAEPLPTVPEPTTAFVVFVGSLALAARCRVTHVRRRR